MSATSRVIAAVLFDLDDTLFPQHHWLDDAWRAVAANASTLGVDETEFHAALVSIAGEGSDRGHIIDRALAAVGAHHVDVRRLVTVFRNHRVRVSPFPGVPGGLERLRLHVPIALVSDGDPCLQQAKLDALGLTDAFDAVVWSDEIGREFRKPDPAPFRTALGALDVRPERAVYVGDRPDKDGVGAEAVGMRFLRVLTGEYRHAPDRVRPWATTRAVTDAVTLLLRR